MHKDLEIDCYVYVTEKCFFSVYSTQAYFNGFLYTTFQPYQLDASLLAK